MPQTNWKVYLLLAIFSRADGVGVEPGALLKVLTARLAKKESGRGGKGIAQVQKKKKKKKKVERDAFL